MSHSLFHRRALAAVGVLALAAGLVACSPSDDDAGGDARLSIRFAFSGDTGDALGYQVAKNQGYFDDEGLDISVEYIYSRTDARDAVANGLVDITNTGITTTLPAVEAGQPVQVVGGIITENPTFIIVRPEYLTEQGLSDASYRALPVQDRLDLLRDAVWGSAVPGTLPDLVSANQLAHYGIDAETDLTINYLGENSAIYSNFLNGTVDVAVLVGVSAARLATLAGVGDIDDLVLAITYDEIASTLPGTNVPGEHWIANLDTVDEDALRAFLRAYQKGVDYLAAHSVDEVTDVVLAEHPDVTSDEAKQALRDSISFSLQHTAFDSRLTPEQVRIAIDFALDQGQITTQVEPAAIYSEKYLP